MNVKRSLAMKKSWRRRKKHGPNGGPTPHAIVPNHPAAYHASDGTVALADVLERANTLVLDGMAKINEAQDLINNYPKRIPE